MYNENVENGDVYIKHFQFQNRKQLEIHYRLNFLEN